MNVHVRVLTIGALAKAAGVTTPTIRYYEGIGLLPAAGRTAAGQRVYDGSDVERLTFIRRCRDFGFSIEQVRLLAGLSISADRDCVEVRDVAKTHLGDVRGKLQELRALEKSLESFVSQCEEACAGGPGRDCVVFKDLANSAGTCCGQAVAARPDATTSNELPCAAGRSPTALASSAHDRERRAASTP
jgi:DNA-binding transcriptional MerR regulator